MHALYRIGDEPISATIAQDTPQMHSKQYLDLGDRLQTFAPLVDLSPEKEAALRRWALFGSQSAKGEPLPSRWNEEAT